jgi:hypothetical protein
MSQVLVTTEAVGYDSHAGRHTANAREQEQEELAVFASQERGHAAASHEVTTSAAREKVAQKIDLRLQLEWLKLMTPQFQSAVYKPTVSREMAPRRRGKLGVRGS